MSAGGREAQLARAQASADASNALQPRGQYPALLARIEAVERTVDRLAAAIEALLTPQEKA